MNERLTDQQFSRDKPATSKHKNATIEPTSSTGAHRNAYLGTRRDGQGRWVRRHFSEKRFPHLVKSGPSSPRRAAAVAESQNHVGATAVDVEPFADGMVQSGSEAHASNKSRNSSVVVARIPKRIYRKEEHQYSATAHELMVQQQEHLITDTTHSMQQMSISNSSPKSQQCVERIDKSETKCPVKDFENVHKESKQQYYASKEIVNDMQDQHMNIISTPKQKQQEVAANPAPTRQTSNGPPITSRRSPIPYEFTGELPSLSESYSFHENHKNNNEIEASPDQISSYSKP